MAISKVTLNGVTLMDVTSDTVEANTLLSGNTATKNDGTKVTGSYTPVTPTYQTKTITPTKSTQTVTPDSNYDALSQVTVNAIPSQYIIPSGTLAVTENGTVDVTQYASADIAVPSSEPVLQEKTVTPTTSVQVITAGTETIEEHVGNEIHYQYSVLTITVNGETEGSIYKKATNNNAQFIPDLSKTYKVWFRIEKWYFSRMDEYEYGTPFECEAVGTFYSNGSNQDLIVPVSDPDGVITSLRVAIRQNARGLCLIPVFGGGASIPTYKNYIKYESKIYTVEEVTYDALSQVTVNAIPSEYVIPTGTLAISQNGTVNVKNYEYANVNVEGGGGGTTVDDTLPVRFLDYDGTIVASYTAEDFANLTAMPSNPSHTGLTAQGWNWTLADAKTQVAEMGACDIGQMYVTDDGKTRIYCHFTEGRFAPYLGIGVNGTVVVDWGDGSATDTLTGTSLTSAKTVQHTYASEGDYVIVLTVSSGSFSFLGTSTTSFILRKDQSTTTNVNKVYTNTIQKIELGNGVNINAYAFANCFSLSSINIPSEVASIGDNTFISCFSLSSITIPSGVTSINTNTFNGCTSLSNIAIPSGVTSIIANAFYNCRSLSSITIPNGVTSIGASAFASCHSLLSINIPSGVTSIGATAFSNCYALQSVTIPSGVTSISGTTFSNCYSLSNITIPNGVTSIGASAFASCYSLQSINIPSGVTSIGSSAFSNGQSLSSITIPSEVTSISASAFSNCYGVAEYHVLPTTPPTLGTTAFNSIQSDCKIYVPSESLEAYKTATNWSTYAYYMVGE